jgi:hypothetical protein
MNRKTSSRFWISDRFAPGPVGLWVELQTPKTSNNERCIDDDDAARILWKYGILGEERELASRQSQKTIIRELLL